MEIMEQFAGEDFHSALRILGRIECDCARPLPTGDPAYSFKRDNELSVEKRNEMEVGLRFTEGVFKRLDLRTSAEAVFEFRTELINWRIEAYSHILNRDAVKRIDEIQRTVRREMRTVLFMYIPSASAEYYDSFGRKKRLERNEEAPLFGNEVETKFASSTYDVAEAGNCLAASRYTACVFHLMRVLEIGLAALAKVFGVSADHRNWHPIIDQVESKIREMGGDPNRSANWKDDQEFYSQAASHFMILKDAWRNYTAHTRGKYTEEEALMTFRNTRGFMQKLATKLSE